MCKPILGQDRRSPEHAHSLALAGALQKINLRGWLFAIPLLFLSVFGSSQSIRFSEFYDFDDGAGGFLSIVSNNSNKFLTQGTNFKNGVRQSQTVQYDNEGSLLNNHAVFDENVGYESFAMIRLNDGQIVSAGSLCDYNQPSLGYCDFYFSKLDETGDTLFTKVIARPDTSDFLLSMVQTRPNKIMLIGWSYNDTISGNADLLFITVDTLGNEVNRVVWGGSEFDYIHSGLVVDNGSVLMTGFTKSFESDDSWVIKTDSIGNVLWYRIYNHLSPSGGDGASSITALIDGNFALAGSYDNPSLTNSWGYIMKINPEGLEHWTKRYIPLSGSQSFWKIEALAGGSILACGQTTNTDDESQAGWLIKTDANGDTLWTRTYNPSDGIDLIRNMLVLPNGDIVMVGFGRGENSTTQDGWILRVDSMGCLVEDCFLTDVNEELEIKNEELRVWPNPTENVLNIVSQMKMETVQLYDMQGRLVYSSAVGHLQEYRVDVSSLGVGMYLLEVRSTEGIQSVRKVMIQRP